MRAAQRKCTGIDTILQRLKTPPGALAFALHIWIAMMLALYAAFWLQLEGVMNLRQEALLV
jgi:hypothetical protein